MPSDDLDLLAAVADDPQGERIAAALAELDQVWPPDTATGAFHPRDCWLYHAECLAARIRATLTAEGDHDAGTT